MTHKRLVSTPTECVCGDHSFLSLTKGYMVIFDSKDSDLAESKLWCVVVNKRIAYAVAYSSDEKGRAKRLWFHREVLGAGVGTVGDHVDHNGLNNKRCNLRLASRGENQLNRRPDRANTTSKYKGVCWRSLKNKWEAYITINRKTKRLGHFTSEENAARAYDAEAIKLHGTFAYLNFPIEAAA